LIKSHTHTHTQLQTVQACTDKVDSYTSGHPQLKLAENTHNSANFTYLTF
jgi:hypothetical protein